MRLFLILCGLLIVQQVVASDERGRDFPDAVEEVSSPPVSAWDGRITPVNNQGIDVSRTTPPPLKPKGAHSAFSPPRKIPDEPERVVRHNIGAPLVFLGDADDDVSDELSLLGGGPARLVPPAPPPAPAPTNWIQKVREFKQMKDEISAGLEVRSPTPSTEEDAREYFLDPKRLAGLKTLVRISADSVPLLIFFNAAKAEAKAE